MQVHRRRGAVYVDKILRGTDAGYLPIEQPTSIDRLLACLIESQHFHGAMTCEERIGDVLAHQAAGVIGPDGAMPTHEVVPFRHVLPTKPIVTVAALTQVDAGRLESDATVGKVLPVLKDPCEARLAMFRTDAACAPDVNVR